jgi:hypothetical protein
MTRVGAKLLCGLLMMLVFSSESARTQKSSGPQGPEEGVIRRQSWLIPAEDLSTMMWTTVFRPPGAGPFPLAVINHGSTQNELQRAGYRIPEYLALTEWLVAHGYAVAVPQRPGHGKTGGTYFEDQGGCAKADFRKAGLNTAGSIAAAVESGLIRSGIMHALVTCNVPFVLAGSIRDDGPLPETYMDLISAQEQYAKLLKGADLILMLSSMLHSIGVGNMTPAGVRLVCVDINPAVVTKLSDRGSLESVGVVTDVGLFLNLLERRLRELAQEAG